jgi:hypothetical protein
MKSTIELANLFLTARWQICIGEKLRNVAVSMKFLLRKEITNS